MRQAPYHSADPRVKKYFDCRVITKKLPIDGTVRLWYPWRMMPKHPNALYREIKRLGITYRQFADLLTLSRGWKAHITHVCAWATGRQRPGIATKIQIQRLTRGRVKAEAW